MMCDHFNACPSSKQLLLRIKEQIGPDTITTLSTTLSTTDRPSI
jgi:hypothetical protein